MLHNVLYFVLKPEPCNIRTCATKIAYICKTCCEECLGIRDIIYITFISIIYLIVSRMWQSIYYAIFFTCILTWFSGGWVGAEIGTSVERFDPEENTWEIVGSMAVPRYNFGCCEIRGEGFWILGPFCLVQII